MVGHPIASFRRLCGGVAVVEFDAFSSPADQREDARMGSAAAIFPDI